jgi:hypothetical protein
MKARKIVTPTPKELEVSFNLPSDPESKTGQPTPCKSAPRFSAPAPTLQDLLDHPAHIAQLDLVEYLNAQYTLENAIAERDQLASLIVEKLVTGVPVQPGVFCASFHNGKLVVSERTESANLHQEANLESAL